MQNEDDVRSLAKIIELIRAVSILLLMFHIYWYCYEMLVEFNATVSILDNILLNFHKYTGLFSNPVWTKLASFVLLAISCLGIRGVKTEKVIWGRIIIFLLIGLGLFFFNGFLLKIQYSVLVKSVLYILTVSTGYIFLLNAGLWMSRLLKKQPYGRCF